MVSIGRIVARGVALFTLSAIGMSGIRTEGAGVNPYEARVAPRVEALEKGETLVLSHVPGDRDPLKPSLIQIAIEGELTARGLEVVQEGEADYDLLFGFGTRSEGSGRTKHAHYVSVVVVDASERRASGDAREIWKGEARVHGADRKLQDPAETFQRLARSTLELLGRSRGWHVSANSIFRRSALAYADFEHGAAAYGRGDFVVALRDWYPLARFGHARAQYSVGLTLASGQGNPANAEESLRWIFAAARSGLPEAQYHLGYLVARGETLLADPVDAHRWMTRAAVQGLEEAAQALTLLMDRLNPEQLARSEIVSRVAQGEPDERFRFPVLETATDPVASGSRSKAVLVSMLVQRDGSVGAAAALTCADDPDALESDGGGWRTDDSALRSWLLCIDAGYSRRAVEMVRGRRYRPASIDGEPVAWSFDSVVRVPRSTKSAGDGTGSPGGPLLAGVGDVTNPILIPESHVQPEFPELARVARLEGRVILQAVIHKDGSVGDIEVLRSTRPNMGFEVASMEAVSQWRYEPALRNGEPVEVYFTIITEFELRGKH